MASIKSNLLRGVVSALVVVAYSLTLIGGTAMILKNMARDGAPLTTSLGIDSLRRPVGIDASLIPGNFGEAMMFIASCEPSDSTGSYPLISGLVDRTVQAPLDEIAKTPIEFFKARPMPLVNVLQKIAMLQKIAERIKKTQQIPAGTADSFLKILDSTDALSLVCIEACRLEEKRSGKVSGIEESLASTKQLTKEVSSLIRSATGN